MKTTIGGDRLGSGNKQNISLKNYNRSTHDLSYLWRSSMSAGTLVPFMSKIALPGDSFDIDLSCEVLTLPTVGPLFGSYKVQLDVFQVPIRLYNAELHMNKLGIGMDMSNVFLPMLKVESTNDNEKDKPLADNAQVNNSCLLKYLGFSGLGRNTETTADGRRFINGIPFLGYWDIYKNYYANKQEERGFGIHVSDTVLSDRMEVISAGLYQVSDNLFLGSCFNINVQVTDTEVYTIIQFKDDAMEPDADTIQITYNAVTVDASTVTSSTEWDDVAKTLKLVFTDQTGTDQWQVPTQNADWLDDGTVEFSPSVVEFDLNDIDTMRSKILQHATADAFRVDGQGLEPYDWAVSTVYTTQRIKRSIEYNQELLGLKTYQSDLFNNWISTEWIDGANGINEVTAVDTTGDSFTIDALNLANKVYNMLNRIAISGGSYDDWLDAVYTHERAKSIESPIYLGSLIKELAFQEVISTNSYFPPPNAQAVGADPLGTLAGRGRLTNKNKGGKIRAKIDEPSYLIGLVSLTPRIDYSQGNSFDVSLKTMNDFHKPALDAIGYQDLITEQMAWQSSTINSIASSEPTTRSAGKQPAWINYMTSVNKTYGNFADINKEMFMTLNRRYEIDQITGAIADLTTYVDPTKFNFIFAQTNIDAQNFWVQISNKITARRKMSAKIIPNL